MEATTNARSEFCSALARVQGQAVAVRMDAENTYSKYRYSTLASMMKALKPVLAENDLSFSVQMEELFNLDSGELCLRMVFIVQHSGGEFMTSSQVLPVLSSNKAPLDKAVLGAKTACTRYALRSVFNVAFDDEEDIELRDDTTVTGGDDPTPDVGPRFGSEWASKVRVRIKGVKGLTIKAVGDHFKIGGRPESWPRSLKDEIKAFIDDAEVQVEADELNDTAGPNQH